jgi:hypothetical protein
MEGAGRVLEVAAGGLDGVAVGGVFCMFAAIGLLACMIDAAEVTLGHALVAATLTGGFISAGRSRDFGVSCG